MLQVNLREIVDGFDFPLVLIIKAGIIEGFVIDGQSLPAVRTGPFCGVVVFLMAFFNPCQRPDVLNEFCVFGCAFAPNLFTKERTSRNGSDVVIAIQLRKIDLGVRQCALKGASHSGQETSTR